MGSSTNHIIPHISKFLLTMPMSAVGAEVRSKPRHCEHVLFMRSNPGERFCAPWIATPTQKSARGLAMTGLRSNFSTHTHWQKEMWGMIWYKLMPREKILKHFLLSGGHCYFKCGCEIRIAWWLIPITFHLHSHIGYITP